MQKTPFASNKLHVLELVRLLVYVILVFKRRLSSYKKLQTVCFTEVLAARANDSLVIDRKAYVDSSQKNLPLAFQI